MQEKEKSIIQMARGAIEERIDYEMAKLVENILDENTKATGVRELTLKIKLVPDDNREVIQVSATASSKLQPTNPIATALYVGKDQTGGIGAVEMVPQVPGQIFTDGGMWQLCARRNIENYLAEELSELIATGKVIVSM